MRGGDSLVASEKLATRGLWFDAEVGVCCEELSDLGEICDMTGDVTGVRLRSCWNG